jgi:hypothetical protein
LKKCMWAIVVVISLNFSGYGLAGSPVPPPEMGFGIQVNTVIECFGSVKQQTSFAWPFKTGDSANIPDELAGGESNAMLRYEHEMGAIGGDIRLINDFSNNAQNVPNLEVQNFVVFEGEPNSTVGLMSSEKKVALSSVSAGEVEIPAANLETAAGSSMLVTGVIAHSEIWTSAIDGPQLYYSILADGVGTGNAYARAELLDSASAVAESQGEHVTPAFASRGRGAVFEQKVSVSGVFSFGDEMFFLGQSTIIGMPAPIDQVP